MEALTEEVRRLVKSGDEKTRKDVLDALSKLSASIESPDDTGQRITFYNMQLAGIRIGIDLKLFEVLTQSETPLTVDDLSKKTGANPVLLGRILRYLASYYAVEEVSKDTFTASRMSKTFADSGFQAGIGHMFNTCGPIIQELPAWLKENHYPDIQDSLKTPFQKAMKTDQPAFIWLQQQPENLAYFNEYMKTNRAGMPTFLDVYPVLDRATNLGPERALFVDIGGGVGHQAVAFRQLYPQLQGRVIVQDLAPTLERALAHPEIEKMPYDFFNPQIVQAKFYYLRNIFHDWPDHKCREILNNTLEAMAPDSYLLVDDMVLPNTGVHWQQAQLDILMMASMGARERTQEQWHQLVEGTGLGIIKIHTYTASLQDSIIEAVLAPKAS
ncbi:S-adenosyl-L-methionine-dependent methyltransferase [Penicillium verhagenii]|uniref:S-adenosyl-L-methionine-dependent methyltransferase n=1 Tax=Penicillium verhagenii TaxID=1562060 RepID=UPI0025453EED|nr:S-adenosyl-L-methionine-dependent methyltransferase [Penicillium verhagenii]KAJ5921469.1 S-adenosyl-L-methionine-dependent methyltransferase [Penicillium verhagenii]